MRRGVVPTAQRDNGGGRPPPRRETPRDECREPRQLAPSSRGTPAESGAPRGPYSGRFGSTPTAVVVRA